MRRLKKLASGKEVEGASAWARRQRLARRLKELAPGEEVEEASVWRGG